MSTSIRPNSRSCAPPLRILGCESIRSVVVVVGDFIIKENFVQCKIIRIIRDSRGWLGARSAVVVVVVLLVGQ